MSKGGEPKSGGHLVGAFEEPDAPAPVEVVGVVDELGDREEVAL
jgi:hypothetical protein